MRTIITKTRKSPKTTKAKGWLMGLGLAALFAAAPAAEAMMLQASVFGSAAMDAAGPDHSAKGTLGQAAAGSTGNARHEAGIGFWWILSGSSTTTAVGGPDAPAAIPKVFSLGQNYPNPFNPVTTFPIAVPKQGLVTVHIFNVQGQLVATLVNEEMNPGNYDLRFQADELASGTYFTRMTAPGFTEHKKFTLLR